MTFTDQKGERTHSEWWLLAAQEVLEGKTDDISARAEAATLFREIEVAISALPPEDNPHLLLAKRSYWAKPIFGIGLSDTPGGRIGVGHFVPDEAITSLNSLSGILSRHSPDYRATNDLQAIESTLERVGAELDSLREMVLDLGESLASTDQARLLRTICRAQEDILFVKYRGYGRLHQSLVTASTDTTVIQKLPEVERNPDVLERVSAIAAKLRDTVAATESIFIPGTLGMSYGVLTGDIAGALVLWVSARRALGPVADGSEPLALPPGGGDVEKQ